VAYTSIRMLTPAADETRFQYASDQSQIVYVGREITLEAHQRVMKLLWLLQLNPVTGIRNLHPAYNSLLIIFDALTLRHDELEAILRQYLDRIEDVHLPEPRLQEIPVCYGGDFGPDLADLSSMHGMTSSQATVHSGSPALLSALSLLSRLFHRLPALMASGSIGKPSTGLDKEVDFRADAAFPNRRSTKPWRNAV
jgi:hypothetical protein